MAGVTDSTAATGVQNAQRRYERERKARLAAETIAERSLRDLYEKKEQLELVRAIAVAANESPTVETALQFALDQICQTTHWPLGHAYVLQNTETGPALAPTMLWHGVVDESTRAFQAATLKFRFARDLGLPGRILASGQPSWISDISTDDNFPRAALAAASKLCSAFAFPVLIGTEVVAVLEFFARKVTEPDEYLLNLAGQIGTQLGRVAERKRTEARLVHDASHDPLTQLPNRALFMDRLTRAIAHHVRHPDSMFAVLFIDLDRFKLVNDSLGHHMGDELITSVAARLATSIRQQDIVARNTSPLPDTQMLARLGGDEFTIFLEDLADLTDALHIADRLQHALAEPFHLGGHELYITASVGIAWSSANYTCAAEILRDADMAMYRAKEQGKARYAVYDDSMYAAALNRLQVEAQLREALERKELLLHYQPIVCLETSDIVGFEALIRWQRPGLPLIYPDQFISIAEDTGLIVPIGTWVLREACNTLVRWNAAYRPDRPLLMSVNLSGRQFRELDLALTIQAVLHETGIDPTLLKLELTESVTMGNAERAAAVLKNLRRLGVCFSIDDFGTGYSSLSYLHRFPLQTLKIDKSFVLRMGKDPESLAIVKTILSLAHSLNMDVIAEGAETLAHCTQLKELGCDYAQGYFYSPPVPGTVVEMLLRAEAICPRSFHLVL